MNAIMSGLWRSNLSCPIDSEAPMVSDTYSDGVEHFIFFPPLPLWRLVKIEGVHPRTEKKWSLLLFHEMKG